MNLYLISVIVFRLLGALSTFVVSLVVTRALGTQVSGMFLLSLSLVLFLSMFCRMGFDNLALKTVSILAEKGAVDEIWAFVLSSSFKTLAFSLPAAVVIFLTINSPLLEVMGKPALQPIWSWLAFSVIAIAIMGVLSSTFQALGHAITSIFLQTIGINMVIVVAVVFGVSKPAILALMQCVSAFCLTSIAFLVLYIMLTRLKLATSSKPAEQVISDKALSSSARSFWIISVLQILQVWGAQYVAGVLLEGKDLSVLVIAQQCSLTLTLVLQAVIMVYAPRFAVMYNSGNMSDLETLGRKSILRISALIFPMFLILFLAPRLILSVFGEGLEGGATALRILALGQLVNGVTGPVGMILMMSGQERLYRNVFYFALPLSLTCAVVLGMNFGVVGFAVTTALTLIGTNIVATVLVRKKLGIHLFQLK